MLNLYESETLRGITGPAIRPGGFELTQKGVSFCRLPKGASVLDVGCGTGATTDYLMACHGLNAFGMDLSELLLEEGLKRNKELPLIRGDATFIPVADASLSAVFCECVLSLTRDPETVLREFSRAIAPGGFLILTDIYLRTPEESSNFASLSFNCCLKGAVGRNPTLALVSKAGFSILTWEDQSNLLKSFAAQMIFQYGSMEKFWSSFCEEPESVGIAADIGKYRPGYYFLAAKKEPKQWMSI